MRRSRFAPALAFAATLALVAAGCGSSNSASSGGSTSSRGTFTNSSDLGLLTPGTLTIGSDIPYPPFEQGKPPGYAGFDVDLVDAIAKKLGLTPKWVDTSFGTIFSDQQAGKFDIVASSASITAARQKKVTFSVPYFDANQSLMVQKGSPIHSLSDVTSSMSLGAQEGTTGQDYAEKHTPATVQTYAAIGTAFNALQAGQVDGVVNDFAVSAYALKKYPQLDVVQAIKTGEQYGCPMQKTNTALIGAVNGALKGLIADGTYEQIFKKWFQKEPPKEFLPTK